MKSARHSTILELVEQYNIETQEDLAEQLRERGFIVTQATISRDIKELRLVKVLSGDGHYKYATVEKAETGLQDRLIRIFSHSAISICTAGNIIVIKTISGSAGAAAEAVDSMKWSEIAGTIAGDNTIFIAVKDIKSVPELIKRFQSMMK